MYDFTMLEVSILVTFDLSCPASEILRLLCSIYIHRHRRTDGRTDGQTDDLSWQYRCLTNSEIRRVVLTVLSSFLRQSCLVFTNVTSELEVFLNVMRYINPRFTYLLTYSAYVNSLKSNCRYSRSWRFLYRKPMPWLTLALQ